MLTYNSFQFDEKAAPDFSKPDVEDPLHNFIRRSQGSDIFEFDDGPDSSPVDGDVTSSGIDVGDHAVDRAVGLNTLRRRRFPQASLRCTQSEESLLSQARKRFAEFKNQRAAISGTELLKLEGKEPVQPFPARPSLKSSSTMPAAPSLRRKARFSKENLRHRNQPISKNHGNRVIDPSKPMRASYRYQQEMTASLEWTQENYEQIMLQARVNGLPTASLPSETFPYYIEEPRYVRQQATKSRREGPHPAPIPSQQPSTAQHISTTTGAIDFTLPPSENRSTWALPDSVYSCYGRSGASQSVPSLMRMDRSSELPAHGRMMQGHQYITEDPPSDCFAVKTEQFQSRTIYPDQCYSAGRQSPPTFPSPPSPAISSSPSAQRRLSRKSSRRKPSAGTLRLSPNNTIDFVNYTPGDSQKILAGVAPSGSSKTKARRELEALEEKRKLSLLTEKAITEVGGDLEPLRSCGLLM